MNSATTFNLSGIMENACKPITMPLAVATPTEAQSKQLELYLNSPLILTTIARKEAEFSLPEGLVSLTIQPPVDADSRPLATINFSPEGWDTFSYQYLQQMAESARKDPKSVPRTMRPFAKLMLRLPEKPTGRPTIDSGRKIVIERNIGAISPAVRDVLVQRLRSWATANQA